jgi:4-amino-4-deoxy-L-arabinose transferase-like glycosyltransferase
MLMTLFGTRTVDTRLNIGWIAGGILGLAILGKGLVPAVLFAPLLLIARGRRIAVIVGAIVIAAPWHILCWIQNGAAFWDDYFWKQHVARFFTPGLEHVQPFWYYIPVLLAGLFPWTPLVALLARKRIYDDVRVTLLTAWILYGFIFFSAARNKLPGYILPLMPAIAIALAVAFDNAPRKEWWLAGCAAMLVVLPVVSAILPAALLSGIRRTDFSFPWSGLLSLAAAGFVWWLARQRYSDLAVLAVALAAGLGILYMKSTTFPLLDRAVSVRAFWRMNRNAVEDGCLGEIRRAWAYGLNYYAGRALPVCSPEYSEKKRVIGISETLSIMVP